jgi:hypothetical protein
MEVPNQVLTPVAATENRDVILAHRQTLAPFFSLGGVDSGGFIEIQVRDATTLQRMPSPRARGLFLPLPCARRIGEQRQSAPPAPSRPRRNDQAALPSPRPPGDLRYRSRPRASRRIGRVQDTAVVRPDVGKNDRPPPRSSADVFDGNVFGDAATSRGLQPSMRSS